MRVALLACCVLFSFLSPAASADTYPNRSVRILVGYAPGGATDLTARVIADLLSKSLGQSVIVENRPGATGNIAANLAKNAVPDGYTLYLGTSINAVSVSLFKNLGYDPVRDFAPVSNAMEAVTILVSSEQLPVKSVSELVAYAKANPGKVTYATTGDGSTPHLCAVLLSSVAGIKMLQIPYKGGGPAMTDLLTGRVDITFSNPVSVIQQVKAGQVRALAVVGTERFSELPDTPTMGEAGYKNFDVNPWYGIFAPAHTPAAIVTRLNADIVKGLADPKVTAMMIKQGLNNVSGTPQAFEATLKHDVAMYAKLLKDAGVSPQ